MNKPLACNRDCLFIFIARVRSIVSESTVLVLFMQNKLIIETMPQVGWRIKATSYERHGVWNHGKLGLLEIRKYRMMARCAAAICHPGDGHRVWYVMFTSLNISQDNVIYHGLVLKSTMIRNNSYIAYNRVYASLEFHELIATIMKIS